MSRQWALIVTMVGVVVGAYAAEADEARSPAEQLAVIEAVQPSLVRVEIALQTDKGQPPRVGGWQRRCTTCGQYHGLDAGRLIEQERPLEFGGFVLSATEVLARDPMVHPRFVRSMAVRFGDQEVEATPAAYGLDQGAVLLRLAEPLKGVKPLEFTADAEPPLLAVAYELHNGAWTTSVKGLSSSVVRSEDGRAFRPVASACLLVDETGAPVGMTMNDELPVDDSWRGSPRAWEMISAADLEAALSRLEERFDRGLARVALSFRSPRRDPGQRYNPYGYSSMDDETVTEMNVMGAVIDPNRVLVSAGLSPKVTARLERIVVHRAEGEPIEATFGQSLKNYGAFVIVLDEPVEGAVVSDEQPITAWRNRLLLAAEVELQGEEYVTYFDHKRISGYDLGYRRRVFPRLRADAETTMLFDLDGRLVAFPMTQRRKVGQEDRWRRDYAVTTPAGHLTALLFGDMTDEVDPGNVPLTEEMEARLAWLGVELQAMDRELARINKVSHLTQDGSSGGMVSYVYPDSPAAAAGIQPGDVLLRLHPEDHPRPIEVSGDQPLFGGQPFPWDRYDDLPEQYFDRIPRPWPPAESGINRLLTDLGFGTTLEAEFARDGEVFRKVFVVEQSPTHFDMAPRVKSEELGVTVRDLTYEVRRYFQQRPDDPGVILAVIEPGSKAAVAGMKPYELITHVNNEAVMNAEDFERLVARQGDLQFSVKRMTRGRVVRINLGDPAEQDAETPPMDQ